MGIGSTATGEVASAATRAPTEAAAASARAAPVPQLRVDVGERAADRRAQFELLGLELGHEMGRRLLVVRVVLAVVLLGRLPLAAARGDLEGLGARAAPGAPEASTTSSSSSTPTVRTRS